MAYFVYVLYSELAGKYYTGQTQDLDTRLSQHNSKEHKGWTKPYQPWTLFWSIKVDSRSKAMKLEKYLKKKPTTFINRLNKDDQLNEYMLERFG